LKEPTTRSHPITPYNTLHIAIVGRVQDLCHAPMIYMYTNDCLRACEYVCVHVRLYVYLCNCICVSACTRVRVRVCTSVFVCVRVFVCVCVGERLRVRVRVHIHACSFFAARSACTYACIHVRIYIYLRARDRIANSERCIFRFAGKVENEVEQQLAKATVGLVTVYMLKGWGNARVCMDMEEK